MRMNTRMMLLALTILMLVGLTLPALGESSGMLEFSASNKMYSAEGKFEKLTFTSIDIPDGDLEQGTVVFEVDLASVWEKAEKLAAHLRTADFFDVEKFAIATVTIDRVTRTDEGMYEAVATIDLHGTTNEVPVQFAVTGSDPLTISGTASLSRTAFGIGGPYDETNDRSITDAVTITMSAELQ